MADQKRVDFQAGGNLMQYMQNIRQEAKRIAQESLQSARDQSDSLGKQIRLIKEAFDLENKRRQATTQARLREDRDIIDKLKQEFGQTTGIGRRRQLASQIEEHEAAYAKKSKYFQDADAGVSSLLKEISDTLKKGFGELESNNEIFHEVLEEDKGERKSSRTHGGTRDHRHRSSSGMHMGFFTDLQLFRLFNESLRQSRQLFQTQNGFDSVVNIGGGAGKIGGGILGAILGTLIEPGGGTVLGGALGAEIGEAILGGVTEQQKRAYDAQQGLLRSSNIYRALTGGPTGRIGDITAGEDMGLSSEQQLVLNTQIARRYGRANQSLSATDVTSLEKALAVTSESVLQLVDVQRYGNAINKDAFSLVTGLLKVGEKGGLFPGGDRTFFGEFLGQFTSLAHQLSQVQTKIDDSLVAKTLLGFNAVGGQFNLRDPRAMSNISAINQALSHPGDDIHQAINMRILREAMPNATLDQLLEEQSKGVFSSTLLRGTLRAYSRAPQGTALTAIRNALGGNLSYDAIRDLFAHRDDIMTGKMDVGALLKSGLDRNAVYSQAKDFTVDADRFQAQVANAYAQGAREGISKSIDVLTQAIKAVFDRSSVIVKVDTATGRAVVYNAPRSTIVNPTWTPAGKKPTDNVTDWLGNVQPYTYNQVQQWHEHADSVRRANTPAGADTSWSAWDNFLSQEAQRTLGMRK